MDWENERYVRVFTRDSADWAMLPWQARVVFYELLRKVDRAGVLEIGRHGIRGLAVLLRLPEDVVSVGAPALFDDGCVVDRGDRVVVPNFMVAQETRQTDAARKRASREKHRAESLEQDSGDFESAKGTHVSPAVTSGHQESPTVTLCLAVPSRAEPSHAKEPPIPLRGDSSPGLASPARRRRSKQGLAGATPDEASAVAAVLERLSDRTGRTYRPETEEHALPVLYTLRRGYTEDDLRTVVWERANKWAGDEKMDEYLRPSTLFGKQKFPEYLAKARAEWEASEREPEQRAIAPPASRFVAGLLGGGS